jgi:hypothetical protein
VLAGRRRRHLLPEQVPKGIAHGLLVVVVHIAAAEVPGAGHSCPRMNPRCATTTRANFFTRSSVLFSTRY